MPFVDVTQYAAIGQVFVRRGRAAVSSNPFILGTTKPTALTVGLLGRPLTPLNGDQIITTPGVTITDRDVFGFIKVRAANVTIQRCRVRGLGPGTGNTAMIDCNHGAASNVLVEDCLLVPDTPSYWLNGMIGHDYTCRRTETYNVVDGFGIYNSANASAPANVVLEGNYVHDLAYFSPDPNHSDNRTHNDGIQIQGNGTISIVGNNVLANVGSAGQSNSGGVPAANPYYPSVTGQALGITPNVSAVTLTTISQNWFDYGAQSITIIPGSFGNVTVGTITNNRFGRNQPNLNKSGNTAKRAILIDPGITVTGMPTSTGADTAGNVYEDDGTPVTVWRHAA